MHLDKKKEEQLEKMEFELEKEYEQEQSEGRNSADMIFESENEKERTDEIQQAGISSTDSDKELQKKKKDMIFELALFFILGVLIGITIKTEAVKKITIGFNDYQIQTKVPRYDIAALKAKLVRQAAQQQAAQETVQDGNDASSGGQIQQ